MTACWRQSVSLPRCPVAACPGCAARDVALLDMADRLARCAAMLGRIAERSWPPPGPDPWDGRERVTTDVAPPPAGA